MHFVVIFGQLFHEIIDLNLFFLHQPAKRLFQLQGDCVDVAPSLHLQPLLVVVQVVVLGLKFRPKLLAPFRQDTKDRLVLYY